MSTSGSSLNFAFWFHLLITLIAWFGAFLFNWEVMVAAYAIVQLQFSVLGKCVVNKHHELDESNDYSFHAFLFEELGFKFDRKKVRFFVRNFLMAILVIIAILWQVILKFEPLVSFF